jgi:hypothetical protein
MRPRDKYANLVWLRHLPTDVTLGNVKAPDIPRPTVQTSIAILGERFGLLVEIEQKDGLYCVRTIPLQRDNTGKPVGMAASYVGATLAAILGAAVRDYMLVEEYPKYADYMPREFVRRVQ